MHRRGFLKGFTAAASSLLAAQGATSSTKGEVEKLDFIYGACNEKVCRLAAFKFVNASEEEIVKKTKEAVVSLNWDSDKCILHRSDCVIGGRDTTRITIYGRYGG